MRTVLVARLQGGGASDFVDVVADSQGRIVTTATASATSPVPVVENAIKGAVALAVGTPATAGRYLLINCTVAGNVSVTFSDTSTLVLPVGVGVQILPWAVTEINTSGTTATATYANLI